LAIVFLICVGYIGYVPEQGHFYHIIIPYTLLFISYIGLLKSDSSFQFMLAIAIIARFVLIFAFPNLSDDIYRFIWDGRLLHSGMSPYSSVPSSIVDSANGLSQSLFSQLNSPNYYSLYPPVAQIFNYLSTSIPSDTFYTESTIYKGLLFCSDLVLIRVLYLIFQLIQKPTKLLFLYVLNPLIIIEISGNVHFEGVMILFLTLTIYYLIKQKSFSAGAFLGASVASKMIPLMYSLSMLMYTSLRRKKYLVFGSVVASALLFAPVIFSLGQDASNIATSLDLYVKKFEFNGSIYYMLRALGYYIYGFNTIQIWGPVLTAIAILAILYISIKIKPNDFNGLMNIILWITLIFLLTSRTVHPWYLSLAVFSCMFTRFRFPILWSYLIFFTYINYSYSDYHENLSIVFIEYFILYAFMIYEWSKKSPKSET